MISPYIVLGVSMDADDDAVRQAYVDAVRRHPPERDPDGFRRVRAAYERIRTRRDRIRYRLFCTDDVTAEELAAAVLRHSPPPRGAPDAAALRRLLARGLRRVLRRELAACARDA